MYESSKREDKSENRSDTINFEVIRRQGFTSNQVEIRITILLTIIIFFDP